jgi:ubiquinone/menaquinone biosynthesis C-methylase UbiE
MAHAYRWMEYFTFGPWLERCRCAFLTDLAGCRRALVFGDGDGRFTAQLLATNPNIKIDAVDSSPTMLRALLRRAGCNSDRVHSACIDAREWRPRNATYDLVVTHFFLDCLNADEIEALAERVRGVTSSSARWVVSEFAIPNGWFGRLLAAPLVWVLYRAFGLLTGLSVRRLPDFHAALRKAGFMLEARRSWLHGLLVSEIWTLESVPLPGN